MPYPSSEFDSSRSTTANVQSRSNSERPQSELPDAAGADSAPPNVVGSGLASEDTVVSDPTPGVPEPSNASNAAHRRDFPNRQYSLSWYRSMAAQGTRIHVGGERDRYVEFSNLAAILLNAINSNWTRGQWTPVGPSLFLDMTSVDVHGNRQLAGRFAIEQYSNEADQTAGNTGDLGGPSGPDEDDEGKGKDNDKDKTPKGKRKADASGEGQGKGKLIARFPSYGGGTAVVDPAEPVLEGDGAMIKDQESGCQCSSCDKMFHKLSLSTD